jgi:hypothetical protein
MRSMKTAVALLVAALAVGGTLAASASAALPELGRCVPAGPSTAEYTGPHCTKLAAPGKGTYQFIPGPGPQPKFEGTGEEPTLQSAGLKITCAAATFNGEYTGAKTATVTVDLIGCLNGAGQKCQSNPVKEGEIETLPLEGEIGFITLSSKRMVGLDLKGSPAFVTFSCGLPPEVVTPGSVEGSVISPIRPNNVMTSELRLNYRVKEGKQQIEEFEGGPKDTLSIKYGLTEPSEAATLRDKLVEILNEEPIEIKSR